MRAAVYRKFGGPEVVRIEEVAQPVPKAGEVLIRVHASTVSVADHRVRAKDLPKGLGFFGPLALGVFAPRKKILGMDVAGTIEAVGSDVRNFSVGDEVVALPGEKFGGHAEYCCVDAQGAICLKPKNLDFGESVALLFGGETSLRYLRERAIKPGDKVLVNGASGAVGSMAVQLAKHFGAHVTGVCSGGNVQLVISLGADQVIDYGTENFTKNGQQYDVIFECVGNAPFKRVENSIAPGGVLFLVIMDLNAMLFSKRASKKSGKLVSTGSSTSVVAELKLLVELAEAGTVVPVIDRTYRLTEIVDAHRYVDTGHKRGNVVVTI